MKTYPKIEILASFGIEEYHHRHRAAGRHNSVYCIPHPLHIEGTLGTYTHQKSRVFLYSLIVLDPFCNKNGPHFCVGPVCTMKILARFYIFFCYVIISYIFVCQPVKPRQYNGPKIIFIKMYNDCIIFYYENRRKTAREEKNSFRIAAKLIKLTKKPKSNKYILCVCLSVLI